MINKGCFKGWYFRCCTGEKTVAFIPARHCTDNTESASLQIITDGAAYNIPFDTLQYREKPLCVALDNCIFSEKGITLNLYNKKPRLEGSLRFRSRSPIRYDIMGPFAVVPFMQCRHSICSMKHEVYGQIGIDGRQYVFKNGTGYIEGDRGRSFPDRYIWTQCCFERGSLMLSVADFPFSVLHFTGIIGVVRH